MCESAEKCRKKYVDHLKDISKLTFIIHGTVHSSNGCKVLGDFVTKYEKLKPNKDHRQEPATKKKVERQQKKNAIF